MKRLPLVARVLLGLILVFFGVIGALAPETDMGEDADAFILTLKDTGYLWPLVKATVVTSGLLLITGIFVPLALVLLAPVALNILLFHLFLSPSTGGLAVAVLVLALGAYLAHHHRSSFAAILRR
ncbi:MAG: DoxX family protein [Acidobacteria bacterium]|nr:DoxX family protein [Acidobacteriota bacterium]